METTASDRLIQKARPHKSSKYGISVQDIGKIPVTDDFRTDLAACLSSGDVGEQCWGLFFSQGILFANKRELLGKELEDLLVQKLPAWLRHQDTRVRSAALPIFYQLRDKYPNYSEIMKPLLHDTDAEVREFALHHVETFLGRSDIKDLLAFCEDPYACELQMGDHLVYTLRNTALEQIERLLGKRFPKQELSEAKDGNVYFWWDWRPFLDWHRKYSGQ